MPDPANLSPTTSVKQQNQLVQSYLDSLLSDVTAIPPAEEPSAWPTEEMSPELSLPRQDNEPDNEVVHAGPAGQTATEASNPEENPEPGQEMAETALDVPVVKLEEASPSDTEAEQPQGRPQWAEETFASLLFEVAGNDLAAPLHELGGICPLADNLKHLAGQADWFLGLLNWNGRQLRVVDTARLLMAESHMESSLEEDYQSVIILGNSNWALAVNRADQSIRLDPQDVKWREHRGNRYWLAGTLQDQLSSLIDVSALRRYLDSMDVSLKALSEDSGTDPA